MFHLAVTALLACVFAMTLDLRAADSTAISTDLYVSQFCTGCRPLIDDTSKDLDLSRSIGTTTHDLAVCRYHGELYCIDFDNNRAIETQIYIENFIDAELGSETSNLDILIVYQGKNQENSGCGYFESKLRDPMRVRQECDNVEPAADDSEFFSMFTLTAVSVSSFALLAGVWLLHRSFRNWQLRTLIARDKRTASVPVRKARRRSNGVIRG